jgi:hypothetical protein
MRTLLYRLLSLAALACPYAALAQPTPADTSALAAVLTTHRRAFANADRLLSGTEYLNYTPGNTTGNQFFSSNIAQLGNVYYDGLYFSQVPLLYDLKLDQLIVFDVARNINIRLIKERVASFTLAGRRFVRLVPDPAAGQPAGFYDVLVDGSPQLLARHTKKTVEETAQQHLVITYTEASRLFISKDRQLTEITNLKTLLNALPEHKAELQKYARSNNLAFGADAREASAAQLVSYYHTLAPVASAAQH